MILYSYKIKVFSAIIVVVALLTQVLQFYTDISVLVMLLGFIVFIYSKEKNENSEIAKIRGKVFQLLFVVLFGIFFSQLFIHTIDDEYIVTNEMIFTSLVMSVFIYLIVFYSFLLLKIKKDILEDKTLIENIRKKSFFYLIYSIITMLFAIFLFVKQG